MMDHVLDVEWIAGPWSGEANKPSKEAMLVLAEFIGKRK